MPVPYCYICEENAAEKRQYGDASLSQGDYCPICYRPTCRFHMSRVRWRWKENGKVADTLICRECKTAYRHRDWDVHHRDWIS